MKLVNIAFSQLSLVSLSLMVLAVVALNETGFCYSKARWLSDKELVSIAVDHEIYGTSHYGIYNSKALFFETNKYCCVLQRFSSDPRLPGLFEAAFGYRNALVELFYRQPLIPPHEYSFYDAFMGIDSCGKVGAWWGIDSLASERPRDAKTWGY